MHTWPYIVLDFHQTCLDCSNAESLRVLVFLLNSTLKKDLFSCKVEMSHLVESKWAS